MIPKAFGLKLPRTFIGIQSGNQFVDLITIVAKDPFQSNGTKEPKQMCAIIAWIGISRIVLIRQRLSGREMNRVRMPPYLIANSMSRCPNLLMF